MGTQVSHAERSHALLSASGSNRWLACTPSARLEEEYGEKKSSPYADEGTLAHELSELYLMREVLRINAESEDDLFEADEAFDKKWAEILQNKLYSPEMLDYTGIYVDYCKGQYTAALTTDALAVIHIEQKLDFSEYVPESFGTADCIIIYEGRIEVIDLKYGKGIPVDAYYNKQLMLYGLGALLKYDTIYDIGEVILTIVQPRLNNISSFSISVEELREWAEFELKPRAKKAYAGEGELSAGEWCRWCGVKYRCRELYNQNMEVARQEFKDAPMLTDKEVADILFKGPRFIEWYNSISEWALEKAVSEDKCWPGFKVVEGRSIRKWTDEEAVADRLLSNHRELGPGDIYNTSLKTITGIEKLIGKKKFEAEFNDLVIKPQGKPTLVPLSDKRPAIYSRDQLEIDFGK
jgi:hypothetical protein